MGNKGGMVVFALIFATLLVLDVLATWSILRNDLSERGQRVAQVVLVWVFPLLGALLVLALYRGPGKASGTYGEDDVSFTPTLDSADPYLDFPDLSGD